MTPSYAFIRKLFNPHRKFSHIELPSKRQFIEVPCECKGNPNHGPHFREVRNAE